MASLTQMQAAAGSELVDKILDRLASEHALTGFTSDLGRIVPWHVWLLVFRAKLSYQWSTFWGQGQDGLDAAKVAVDADIGSSVRKAVPDSGVP